MMGWFQPSRQRGTPGLIGTICSLIDTQDFKLPRSNPGRWCDDQRPEAYLLPHVGQTQWWYSTHDREPRWPASPPDSCVSAPKVNPRASTWTLGNNECNRSSLNVLWTTQRSDHVSKWPRYCHAHGSRRPPTSWPSLPLGSFPGVGLAASAMVDRGGSPFSLYTPPATLVLPLWHAVLRVGMWDSTRARFYSLGWGWLPPMG